MVRGDAEAWILCSKTIERNAHLFLVGLRLGLHRHFNDWVGEFHAFQDDRRARRAQCIPGRSFFETRQRSEEHTSELQSLMRISYAVFCLKKKNNSKNNNIIYNNIQSKN